MNLRLFIPVFLLCMFLATIMSHSQNRNSGQLSGYPSFLKQQDSIRASKIPEIKFSRDLDLVELPSSVDNSVFPYMRPVFNQQDYSCGQAAGVGYAFTYEINRLRDLPADTSINQYPSHFVWDFSNNGLPDMGVSYFDSWDIIRHCGTPNAYNFGGTTSDCQYWVTGYEKYYEGMQNRLYDFYQIKVNTPEGLITAKNWLHNHLSGSNTGGVANCYGSFGWPVALPPGTPLAGKPLIIYSYYPADHAVTIVGYNDSIRYDVNNDGQYTNHLDITGDGTVDVQDWEIGGFLFVNSHGLSYPENGYCYILYRLFALEYNEGGLWNHSIHIMKAKEENTPQLTMKVLLKHNSRYKIKVMAGISDDLNSTEPQFTMEFPIFNFQGGNHYMQGGNEIEENKTIEAGFDISPLLSYVTSGAEYKIFLMVTENDPENSATGEIVSFSVMDYTNGVEEVICDQTNVAIGQNTTTKLSVIKSLDFPKPEISTSSLPKATVNQPYSHSLSAAGGKPPYRWSLKKNYETETSQGSFPQVPTNPVELNDFGYATIDLGFQFPFFGKLYDKITVFEDGYVTFTEELYPWPYILPQLNFFQSVANISLFNCRAMYFYPDKGDGIRFYTDDLSAVIAYQGSVYGLEQTSEINVAARIFYNGRIEIYYGNTTIPAYVYWISGISEGTGSDFFMSPFTNSHPVPFAQMHSFSPVLYPDNLSVTQEGVISGTPLSECITPLLIGVTDDNNISGTKELAFKTSGVFVKPIVLAGNDEKINAGDTVKISLALTNLGNSLVTQVSVDISIDDPFILMMDDNEAIGSIGVNQTIIKNSALCFVADSLIPNNQIINISVVVSGSMGNQNLTWQYVASSPELCMKNYSVLEPDDGWLDPGESGEVLISVNNCGASNITNVYGQLSTLSEFIQINDPVQNFGNLPEGSVAQQSFGIQVDGVVPYKHNAKFIFTMWGEGGIISTDSFNIPVNRLPVLILRLGSNPASADAMKNAFDQLGVGNEIIDLSVPENFMWYKSVFVSLGHYYANHSFTEAESYYLENFLNQKGNLYVEGVTTWNNDPQRSIHSKFNISKAVHAWYNLDSLIGVQGTLMHNINLDFVSANATANYYLEAIPPAEVFAENQTNSGLGIGVWYDQGNYKTIGTMTEFGSMADNGTSTRRDLMAKYMDFFEIPVNPVSIEDEALISTQRFELIPNPARHDAELIIEMPEKEMIHYQLFDITGHSNQSAPIQFFAGKGINRITLNFGQLLGAKYSKGLYVLKLTGSHFTKSLKIILSE